jgi:hypothetical protein
MELIQQYEKDETWLSWKGICSGRLTRAGGSPFEPFFIGSRANRRCSKSYLPSFVTAGWKAEREIIELPLVK